MPQLKGTIKHIASIKGLYFGAIMALITLGAYFINWDIFMNPILNFSKFFLAMIFAIWATVQAKKEIRGKFSFRDGFSSFFIVVAIGFIISALVNWLLLSVMDPEAGNYINTMSRERLQGIFKQLGKDETKIEEAGNVLKNSDAFSFLNQIKGYFLNLVLYCIPAALAAAIFKTKKPIIR